MNTGTREPAKQLDVGRTVNYLSVAFQNAIDGTGPALSPWVLGDRGGVARNNRVPEKGTEPYRWQTEFCYLIDDIQRGSPYMAPKIISECNALISSIEEFKKAKP